MLCYGIKVKLVSSAVNSLVAPCFKRGKYKQILDKAKYYQDVGKIYDDLIACVNDTSEKYYNFVRGIEAQNNIYQQMKDYSKQLDSSLKDLYDSI